LTTLALAAARSRAHLTGALLAVAAAGWIVTAIRMSGMDEGPWTSLGTPGWFIGVWAAMTAAMMLPSAWPTVAVYSRMSEGRSGVRPALFTAAYFLPWIAFGALVFAIVAATERLAGDVLAWERAGRVASAAALLVAAAYELTPLKTACLKRCRSPIDLLLPAWRRGLPGALDLGARHGAWCVGCCWALMVSLFALGVMSIFWGAVVAIVIAAEKLLERRRLATHATAGLLAVLGVLVLAAPQAVPELTIPVG
jgi:predicted metal-binding membrane protein